MPDIPAAASPLLTAVQATAQSGATSGSSSLTALQVAIADLSQAFENLTRAIQTPATVTDLPTSNTVTLATQLGNVTVTLPPQLSAAEQQSLVQQLMGLIQSGKPVTLGIAPGAPPTQAVLLLPAAAPPPIPNATTAPQQQPATPALPPLAIGDDLPAVILPPDIALPAPSLAPSVLPANIPIPPQESANAANPMPPVAGQPATTPPLAAAPPQATDLDMLLQPGTEVSLRVVAILPPSSSSSAPVPLPPLAANQIVATVAGTGTDGQLILKAGDATLFVKAQVTAPIGSTVILDVNTMKAEPLVTFPSIEPVTFQALPQALATLAQNNPQILQQIFATHIPQPTETLPGAMLLLFNAFKQGSLSSWLGEEATESLLRAGKLDLVASLSRELGNAGQPMQDSVVGDWRSYPIPLYSQQQFHSLTLHVHGDRDGRGGQAGNAANSPGKIRFLIDMSLSKLGALQIDGFVQPKKLDMILRSENTLPPGMHHDLRGAYIKALGAVGYVGSINFQVGRKYWLTMQRQTPPGIVT